MTKKLSKKRPKMTIFRPQKMTKNDPFFEVQKQNKKSKILNQTEKINKNNKKIAKINTKK
jgi:hypothetical protein